MSQHSIRAPQWILAITISLILGLGAASPVASQTAAASCASGYALWADGRTGDEVLTISGSGNVISGAARSNADLRISGSNNRISGAVEYVSLFDDGGDANTYPAPTRVAAAGPPLSYTIADYRPGGSAATAAQAAGRYQQISGDLDVSEPRVLSGLYYVTGDAKLSASDISGTFTIVAEGMIDVSGSQIRAQPYAGGLLLFSNKDEAGASVIKLAGSDSALNGVIYGPTGTVELSGSNSSMAGVILGEALKLNGSNLRISFAGQFCPGGQGTPPPTRTPNPEPPSRITIDDDDVERLIEVVDGVTFVTIRITFLNTGGRATNVRLVLDLNDDDDDDDDDGGRFILADVRFIEGAGYVREREGSRTVIGIGLNNVLSRNSPVTVSVRYRLGDDVRDDDDDGRLPFIIVGQLLYSDSDDSPPIDLPMLRVPLLVPIAVVPVAVVPVDVPRLTVEQIDVRFRATWESRGGLAIFGLPLTLARTRGDGTVIQIFERARMEYRPGPATVQLGLIAVELGYGAPRGNDDDLDDDDRPWYFAETGHVIGGSFRQFWSGRGGLLLFGLPIAGLSTDDDGRQAQCFERACLQLFPEYAGTAYEVQLRLLGVELVQRGDDDDD